MSNVIILFKDSFHGKVVGRDPSLSTLDSRVGILDETQCSGNPRHTHTPTRPHPGQHPRLCGEHLYKLAHYETHP